MPCCEATVLFLNQPCTASLLITLHRSSCSCKIQSPHFYYLHCSTDLVAKFSLPISIICTVLHLSYNKTSMGPITREWFIFSALICVQVIYIMAASSVQAAGARNTSTSGLRLGFYSSTCPRAEIIVRETVAKYMSKAPSLAAPLLRTHFHDCFDRVSH